MLRRLSAQAPAASTRWWEPIPLNEPQNLDLFKREKRMATLFRNFDSKFTLAPVPPSSEHIFNPSQEELPATMDPLILPHLTPDKSEEELARLRSFLGRPCLINHKFWNADDWAKKEVAHYFEVKQKKIEWDKQVKLRHKYLALDRVREKAWVFADSRDIFSQKRRLELFGENQAEMSAIVFGHVVRKRFGYLEVAWRVPNPELGKKLGLDLQLGKTRPWWDFLPYQTIKVIHHEDSDLDTLWPEEYIHKEPRDEFKAPPQQLHREDWVRELVIEHRMVVFTDSMECPEYKRLITSLGENPNVHTVSLDRAQLIGLTHQEQLQVRESITNVTNYPHFPQFFLMRMFVGGMIEFDRDVYNKDDIPGFSLFMRLTGVVSPDYHLRPYTRYLHHLFTLFHRKWFLHDKRKGYKKFVPQATGREDPYSFMEDCYRLEREEFCKQAERVIPFLEQRMQEMSDEVGGPGDEIPEGVPLNVLIKMIYHPYFEDLQLRLKENRRKLQKLRANDHKISATGLESNLEALEQRELADIDELEDDDGSLEQAKLDEQVIEANFEENGEDTDEVIFRHFKPKHADKEVFRDEDLFNQVEANERYIVQWIEEEEKFQTDEEYATHLRSEMNAIMQNWTKEKRRDFFTVFYKQLQGKARYAAKLYRVPKGESEKQMLEQERLHREVQFQLAILMRRMVQEERKAEACSQPIMRRPTKAQLLVMAETNARKKLGMGGEDTKSNDNKKNEDIDNSEMHWEAVYSADLVKN
ncbi:hypothetical protein BASA81_000683 [Batrachochytrium salamandrivorans]|nr:hypothetical protein BASA81_000683 [Batrachochytrium salamandrivorans]